MKNKTSLAILSLVLAFALCGAKDAPRSPVEVGRSYLISNGKAAVVGKVVEDMGGGWFRVERDGRGQTPVAVNIAQALFVEELAKAK